MLAAHYVFNMEYHSMVKDVFYFLQEKVFDFPDTIKKSSIYLCTTSAIDLYLPDAEHWVVALLTLCINAVDCVTTRLC